MGSGGRREDWTRRRFLGSVGAGVPTLTALGRAPGAPQAGLEGEEGAPHPVAKFTRVDLSRYLNASPADFGPREKARQLSGEAARDGLIRTPGGARRLQGIPFWLGPDGVHERRWVVLREGASDDAPASPGFEVPVGRRAGYLCVASFCDWDENEEPAVGEDVVEKVGQPLADVVLRYGDGNEERLPLRRRFEVSSPSTPWGHLCFAAEAHRQHEPAQLGDPLPAGTDWGSLQPAVHDMSYPSGPDGRTLPSVWIAALVNPRPDAEIVSLRFEARAADPFVLCGLTLFHGSEMPLRYSRLTLYRLRLPEPAGADPNGRWKVEVDLGVVVRRFGLADFDGEKWLAADDKGLGGWEPPDADSRHLYAEVAASRAATLFLRDEESGRRYAFDLAEVAPGRELEGRPAGAGIEVLEHEKTWLHGRAVDASTGAPTPVRLAFRNPQGRYIPPYGHRTEINDGWFQDYGADVKLGDTSFAYVDGTFQVELPTGEVFVEMTKGFEYEPVRRRLEIQPGQRELRLEIPRHVDLRAEGWVTADTHVHFLSPSTAVLEAQAEGLNLVNLLAAQWGDLFTNVGDLSHGSLTSRDGETLVQVSTENRQHILGHLALLGVRGEPVYPMSASGPSESQLGTPVWSSLADWAEACRERQGLAVAVHFPYPTAELPADIVLGRIDAVELAPYAEHFNSLRFLDWYRYLNCGYRVPGVGGTDKMGAYMPVGATRTYAYLGEEQLDFDNWARAVRSGNTFMSTGPLLLLDVDGRPPGAEIAMRGGSGTVEVRVRARSAVPFHRLEVIVGGRVAASGEAEEGVRELELRERIRIDGPTWIAARCSSEHGPTTRWGVSIQAHTSPVYVVVPGRELFSEPAVRYFLTLLDGAETWLDTLATRPDPERHAQVRRVLTDARAHLHERLHAHGIPH